MAPDDQSAPGQNQYQGVSTPPPDSTTTTDTDGADQAGSGANGQSQPDASTDQTQQPQAQNQDTSGSAPQVQQGGANNTGAGTANTGSGSGSADNSNLDKYVMYGGGALATYFVGKKIVWPIGKFVTQPIWRPLQWGYRLATKPTPTTSGTSAKPTRAEARALKEQQRQAKLAEREARATARRKQIELERSEILEQERGRNPFLRDAPKGSAPNFTNQQDEELYQNVLKRAAKDRGAFGRGLSEGDIQHYIRQEQEGPRYRYEGTRTAAPADEAELNRVAKNFLDRMQQEGRLGSAGAGIDPVNSRPRFMPDAPVEVPRAGKWKPEWRSNDFMKGLRRERPAEFRMAELNVAEDGAGAGRFGRVVNYFKKPIALQRALPEALEGAAPGVAVVAEEGVARVGLRRLGVAGAVVVGSWDVVQSVRHHESLKKTEITAGNAAGQAIGGWAAFEAGALVGGAIGAGFFGVGSIPGALIGGAVGLGASFVGAHYGGKIGAGIVRHFTGRPIEEQLEQMQKYFNADKDGKSWNANSDLAKQAMKDGFGYVNGKQVTNDGGMTALKEAHWASILGFENSTDYHEVEAAAAKAHRSAQDLINIVQNEYRKETKNPKATITGSDVARFLKDNPNTDINQMALAASAAAPRDGVAAGPRTRTTRQESVPSLSHDMARDQLANEPAKIKEIEGFLKDQTVANGSVGESKGFKDIAGKNYLDAYHGNLSLALQAYNIDHGNYDALPAHKRNGQVFRKQDDLDGKTDGPRSQAAIAKMLASDTFKDWDQKTRQAAAPQPTVEPAAPVTQVQQSWTRPAVVDVPLVTVPDKAIKAGDGESASRLQVTGPQLGAPISASLSEVDKRTAKDERLVIADLANDPHHWVLNQNYRIYDATQERDNIDRAFAHEVKWKAEKEGAPIKHLYFVFQGNDPKEAGAFFAALQASESKHNLQAAPKEIHNKQEQAFVANARPGESEERRRHNLFGFLHLPHHDHDKPAEDAKPDSKAEARLEKKWEKIAREADPGGYEVDPKTGNVVYNAGPGVTPDQYSWQGQISRNIKLAALKTNFAHGDQGADQTNGAQGQGFDSRQVAGFGRDLADASTQPEIDKISKFLVANGYNTAAATLNDIFHAKKPGEQLTINETRNVVHAILDQSGGHDFGMAFGHGFDQERMTRTNTQSQSFQAINKKNVKDLTPVAGTPF